MATSEMIFEKSNGRLSFKIGGSIVVSAKNDGWANGTESGTSTDGNLTMTFDNTKSFWKLKYVNTVGTQYTYIDGKNQ